jgi:ABC-type bacteriocin/lantibiotic exporter with double-glycine peptidase domain
MKKIKSIADLYFELLHTETNYFLIAIVYGAAVSVITLAIPISVQALVNTIAFGVLTQPLVILSILLLGFLSFSGVLKALQTYIIEIYQRHFYIKVSTDVVHNLMLASKQELNKTYAVELVNRYFDIMTVKKKSTSLITGGVSLVLQIILGLLLLAFYHPYFLIFDVILVVLLSTVWILYGRKAMASSIEESDEKYRVAYWLEEVARENSFFKRSKYTNEVYAKTNEKVGEYIKARKKHFANLFKQIILLLIIYAILSALILGLGGFLVIQEELSLGQLVAAELIVTMILAGLAGAGKYLEDFYDLYAALNKLSYLYKLKRSDFIGKQKVDFDHFDLKVHFDNNDVVFEQGKSYLIRSSLYSSKVLFADLIRGFDEDRRVNAQLGQHNYERLCTSQINDKISVIKHPHFFHGTILENLTFGKGHVASVDLEQALKVVDLGNLRASLPEGLHTVLNPKGYPLSPSQLLRLSIAREILAGTEIIVAMDVFHALEKPRAKQILSYLSEQSHVTLIVLSIGEFDHYDFDNYFYMDGRDIFICKDAAELAEYTKGKYEQE